MEDPFPSSWLWWLALAGAGILYLLTAFTRVAFRMLGPVTLAALVERAGPERTGFLRKSLSGPSGFWFALQLATAATGMVTALVLFAGQASLKVFGAELSLYPTGRIGNDVALFFVGVLAVAVVELVLPLVAARLDRVRFVERCLPFMRVLHVTFAPLTVHLARWSDEDDEDDDESSDEELSAYIDWGGREGILEEGEGELLRNVVTFGDTRVYEVMTPRTDVVGIEKGATVRELVELVSSSRLSRIPVHGGQLDDIVGVATLKDAVEAMQAGQSDAEVTTLMRPPYLVPETKRVSELLRELQERRQQMAILVDEYGGTAGLVTVEDLLEEIVGEIRDEHEPEGEAEDVRRSDDGSWLVRGRASLHDASELIGADLEVNDSSTMAGLLLSLCDRVPVPGESVNHAGLRFETIQADRKRVLLVKVTPLEPPPSNPA